MLEEARHLVHRLVQDRPEAVPESGPRPQPGVGKALNCPPQEVDPSERVPVAGGLSFREVKASSFRTCGVTMNERLFCWGHNQTGQLGDGTQTDRRHPVRIGRGLVFR